MSLIIKLRPIQKPSSSQEKIKKIKLEEPIQKPSSSQEKIKLEEDDHYAIQRLANLDNKCKKCGTFLFETPQIRNLWIKIEEGDFDTLSNKAYCIQVCNACGIYQNKKNKEKNNFSRLESSIRKCSKRKQK